MILQEVDAQTSQEADDGGKADVFQVPDEVYFFQSHGDYSGCGAYDEDAASGSGAVGCQVPECTVLYEVGHVLRFGQGGGRFGGKYGVHAYRRRY